MHNWFYNVCIDSTKVCTNNGIYSCHINRKKRQQNGTRASDLVLGSITANTLSFGGKGSCMGSAMVSLDRTLLNTYRLYSNHSTICNSLAAINAMQDLTGDFDPQIYHAVEDRVPI